MGMYSSLEGTNVPSSQNGLPNVSQFGWTSYEMEEYKQLIEYVDEAKRYNNEVKDNIVYVEALRDAIDDIKKHIDETVAGFDVDFSKIEEFKNLIQSWYDQIRDWKDHIEALHTDITAMRDYLDTIRIEILSLRDQVQALKDAASISETNAANSATVSSNKAAESLKSAQDAQKAFQDCYDLYLDLVKGQIYRGTWNPNSGSYPDAKNTNSVWDVVLNPNQEEVVFDNKRWFWGDRLIYVLTDNTFNQIEAGTVVKSVNGKVGAVTLTAIDVNAVPVTGGEMTGTLVHRTTGDIPFQTFFNPTDNSYMQANHKDDYLTWRFGGTDTTKGFRINDYDNERFTFQRNGQLILKGDIPLNSGRAQLFHDGNTSAPGILFPTRSMREHAGATWIWEKVADGAIYYSTGTDASRDSTISLNVASGKITGKVLSSTGEVYVKQGSTTTGEAVITGGDNYFVLAPKLPGQSDYQWGNALRYYEDGWRVGSANKIYHQGFKPTAADVGAVSTGDTSIWKNLGSFPDLNGNNRLRPGYFSYNGNTPNAPTTAYGHGFAVGPGPDAGSGVWGTQMVFTHGNQVFFRNAVNTGMSASWNRFYTSIDKPTLADIGAAPSGYGLGESTRIGITQKSQFFSEPSSVEPHLPQNGAGWQSCYAPNRRAQAFINGNGDFFSRFSTREEVLDSTTTWAKHYTTLNKPTANDIGAVASNTKTIFNAPFVMRTSDYAVDSTLQNMDFAGFYRTNGVKLNDKTLPALMIHCPHSVGKAHARGIGFSYGTTWGAYTYRFDDKGVYQGQSKIYHEQDKPTYTELGVVSASANQDIGGAKNFTGSINFSNINSFQSFSIGAGAVTVRGRNNLFDYRFGGDGSVSGISLSDYETAGLYLYKSGNIISDGVFEIRSTPAQSTNQAQIFHNGKGSSGSPINIRSMRESGGATWIWEKVSNGSIFYSTGVNGGGSTRINFNIGAGTGQAVGGFSTGSDSRFKEDIQYVPTVKGATPYLDKMCSLNAARFKYKGVSAQRFGLIAQDVEKVLPDAIESHSMGADGKSEERLFLDPLAIIAAQNEALKELKTLVESLQSRMTVLENA